MLTSIDFGNGFRFYTRPESLAREISKVRYEKAVGLIASDANENVIAMDAQAHALYKTDAVRA